MAEEEVAKKVAAVIRDFPDFPKPGILFKDVMPLMKDPALLQQVCEVIAERARRIEPKELKITGVAGLEARGFLFGPQVAMLLKLPFIPIRKAGKLPGTTVEAEYVKEYGKDVIAVQAGSIVKGDCIFIIDDLLATGGTMKAALDLVEKCGGRVGEGFVLIELDALKGRTLFPTMPIHAMLHF